MSETEANLIIASILVICFLDVLHDIKNHYCCRRASIEKCENCRDWKCPRWHTEFIDQMKQEALTRDSTKQKLL